MTPEERDEMWADLDRSVRRHQMIGKAMDIFWLLVIIALGLGTWLVWFS